MCSGSKYAWEAVTEGGMRVAARAAASKVLARAAEARAAEARAEAARAAVRAAAVRVRAEAVTVANSIAVHSRRSRRAHGTRNRSEVRAWALILAGAVLGQCTRVLAQHRRRRGRGWRSTRAVETGPRCWPLRRSRRGHTRSQCASLRGVQRGEGGVGEGGKGAGVGGEGGGGVAVSSVAAKAAAVMVTAAWETARAAAAWLRRSGRQRRRWRWRWRWRSR